MLQGFVTVLAGAALLTATIPQKALAATTLNAPTGINVDVNGNLYVANQIGNNVTIYGPNHALLSTLTQGLSQPYAVTSEFGGNILITNVVGNDVAIFNAAHVYQGSLTDGQFINPEQIYVDTDNDIWVLDSAAQLHTFLSNGVALTPLPVTGARAVGPWGAYVVTWGTGQSGASYLAHYQARGEAVHYGPSLTSTLAQPVYVGFQTQDSQNQLYLTDQTNNRVGIYAADGVTLIDFFPTPYIPVGIAVDEKRNFVYVSFVGQNQVGVYSLKAPHALLHAIN